MPKTDHSAAGNVLGDLLRVLETERALLLSGEIGALPAIASRKEKLLGAVGAINRDTVNPALLERVRTGAEQNARLLSAALDGIRVVKARLEAIRTSGSKLETYDSKGHRADLLARGTLERRA